MFEPQTVDTVKWEELDWLLAHEGHVCSIPKPFILHARLLEPRSCDSWPASLES